MKKKNFKNLTDKQKEEEIAKLGTSLIVTIPNDAPFGLITAALTSVLGFYLVESDDPQEAFKTVVSALTAIVNKYSHEDDNTNS